MGEEESSIVRCQEVIKDGGCEIDRNYTGPMLETVPPSDPSSRQTKYKITQKFVDEMIDHYRNGKALHRRIIWEIVLGVYSIIVNEPSMVEVPLDEGVTCDIIGDTHGMWCYQNEFLPLIATLYV